VLCARANTWVRRHTPTREIFFPSLLLHVLSRIAAPQVLTRALNLDWRLSACDGIPALESLGVAVCLHMAELVWRHSGTQWPT